MELAAGRVCFAPVKAAWRWTMITNVWLLGVLSFGEGFHDHRHAFPASARMGRAPHELDLGWLTVRALRRCGLVHDVLTGSARARPASRPWP